MSTVSLLSSATWLLPLYGIINFIEIRKASASIKSFYRKQVLQRFSRRLIRFTNLLLNFVLFCFGFLGLLFLFL